jgi:hypothetical protein
VSGAGYQVSGRAGERQYAKVQRASGASPGTRISWKLTADHYPLLLGGAPLYC